MSAPVIDGEPVVRVRESSRGRRVGTWIAIAVVILLVGAIGGALSALGRFVERDAFDPDSPAPNGTRALVEILRDQGIDVVVARDRETAARALAGSAATLVLPDAPALSDAGIEELADAGAPQP